MIGEDICRVASIRVALVVLSNLTEIDLYGVKPGSRLGTM